MDIKAEFITMLEDGTLLAHVGMEEYDNVKALPDIEHEILDDVTQTTHVGTNRKMIKKIVTKGYLIPKTGKLIIVGIDETKTEDVLAE